MSDWPKQCRASEAPTILSRAIEACGAQDCAVVRNPGYIYAPVEIYPLAPRPAGPLAGLAGIVKDMDGTTTTTEALCLHSLEWMVRRVSKRPGIEDWSGLDSERDYPHVIGNSTTKHVEYLIETYPDHFDPAACLEGWIEAALWTLSRGRDAGRREEMRANLGALGLEGLAEEPLWRETVAGEAGRDPGRAATELAPRFLPRFRCIALSERVRAATDIYYMRYHQILAAVSDGRGAELATELLGPGGGRLIAPLPGVGALLGALKGLLGERLADFYEPLAEALKATNPAALPTDPDAARRGLAALGRYLAQARPPVAVVTSSIAYEAGVVLGEVFDILREEVADWPLDAAGRERALEAFASPEACYDAILTASDSSEIRLKPHRDLYAMALHRMGLGHEDYARVIGFEDSESGVVAIRAAGIGCSVAVPFADTAGHDLSAAAHLLPGQLPEALLSRALFLDPALLAAQGAS